MVSSGNIQTPAKDLFQGQNQILGGFRRRIGGFELLPEFHVLVHCLFYANTESQSLLVNSFRAESTYPTTAEPLTHASDVREGTLFRQPAAIAPGNVYAFGLSLKNIGSHYTETDNQTQRFSTIMKLKTLIQNFNKID